MGSYIFDIILYIAWIDTVYLNRIDYQVKEPCFSRSLATHYRSMPSFKAAIIILRELED